MLPVGFKLTISVSILKQQQNSKNFIVSSPSLLIKYNAKETNMEEAITVSLFGLLLKEPGRSRELWNYFTALCYKI